MSSSKFFSNQDSKEILREYQKRKQLNSQLGLKEQYDCLLKWAKTTKAEPRIIKQAFENFRLLSYREWLESWFEVDCKCDADWREGYE